jgi:predicted RNA binding protein YcfA (HicA-like mRNA interferase family)
VTGNEKLIEKFLTEQTRITIEDCDRLLADFGYDARKKGGSHRTYHKQNALPITVVIPKGTKYVKASYIKFIARYLKLED